MNRKSELLPDLFITVPLLLILSLGVLVIYSSDTNLAIFQALFTVVGLFLYWASSYLDFEAYDNYIKYLYYFIIALLIIVFFIGEQTRGSWRWIPLGPFSIQPSEFAKPILILILAKFWSTNLPSWFNILKSLLIVLPIAALVFKQPDLGTTITIMAIWLMMLIGANISLFKLIIMGVISILAAPVSWIFLKEYQKARVFSFLFPNHDPLGVGYNVIQSTIAVGSGQVMGRGLGRGTQSRLQFLPEFRTDFIFASIAEEFGFLGSMIVLTLYGIIIAESIRIIHLTSSRFGSLLVFGVLGMLIIQIVVNIGMNIGIVPITGITLPLLSYGGSSLISTLICLGFIASVARKTS